MSKLSIASLMASSTMEEDPLSSTIEDVMVSSTIEEDESSTIEEVALLFTAVPRELLTAAVKSTFSCDCVLSVSTHGSPLELLRTW